MSASKETVPVEIEDDYQLALDEADVDDESANDPSSSSNFVITSYGADYTVDTIISRVKSEAFYVPTFQRNFVWSQRHASRFVESLLMGLPVPGIFLYKEPGTNKHLVVDGQQRLRTLQYFYEGTFLEKKFRLVGVRPEWEGKTYNELPAPEQLKLDDSIVHATIFQQDEPKDSQKSLYFVFERINSGGIRLSPQEIRNCISDGPVMDAIRVLNDDPNWRAIFGQKKNARLKDQELVLRALAMFAKRDSYQSPMRDFLNDFATSDGVGMQAIKLLSEQFGEAIKICNEGLGKSAFRPIRALNAAVYEAVIVGIAERLTQSPQVVNLNSVQNAYDKLLQDQNFLKACVSATATVESVKTRQRLAIAAFKSV
ncbi:DUF262 domain-containing protein [Bradyrhizobium sp. RDM4]|uniref:DUF262 domain-containing protein n=1 Tax=Bradyrhizobium sp. RDM4 TaxID=3378765 RepID=UPI0038FC57C2